MPRNRKNQVVIRVSNQEKEDFTSFAYLYLGSLTLFFRLAGRNLIKLQGLDIDRTACNFMSRAYERTPGGKGKTIASQDAAERLGYCLNAVETKINFILSSESELNEYMGAAEFLDLTLGHFFRVAGLTLIDKNKRCPEVDAVLAILNPKGLLFRA